MGVIMKEKKKYTKAYRNLLKSYFAIFLLSIALFLVIIKVIDGFVEKDMEFLISNLVAIIVGILTSLLVHSICNIHKDAKNYVDDIEQNNEVLKTGLNNLILISNMIDFNVKSKKSELEILSLYKDIQINRNLLINNNLFDNISIVGINSLFDNLSTTLLKISTKKEFIDESTNLLTTIDNITKMIEEVIMLNDDEKDAFLKEKERLENLFNEKKNTNK